MNDRRRFLSVLAFGATAAAASRMAIAEDNKPRAEVAESAGRLSKKHRKTPAVSTATTPLDSLPPGSPWYDTHAIYWGDLHSHSNVSSDWNMTLGRPYAKYEPADYFRDAVLRGLHFCAITDHAECISDADWYMTVAAAKAAEKGGFIPILGYEVCEYPGQPQSLSPINVLFKSLDGTEQYVFGHSSYAGKSAPNVQRDPKHLLSHQQIWATLGNRAIGQLTVTRRPQDLASLSKEEVARIRLVEAFSTDAGYGDMKNGQSSARAATAEGRLRAGLVGVSNNHGIYRPSGPNGPNVDYSPGPGSGALTAVVAQKGIMTRDHLLSAIEARQVYAVLNRWPGKDYEERIQLSFHANVVGHTGPIMMGQEVHVPVGADGLLHPKLCAIANHESSALTGVDILYSVDGKYQDAARKSCDANCDLAWDAAVIRKGETHAYVARVFIRDPSIGQRDDWKSGEWKDQYPAAVSSPIWITAT